MHVDDTGMSCGGLYNAKTGRSLRLVAQIAKPEETQDDETPPVEHAGRIHESPGGGQHPTPQIELYSCRKGNIYNCYNITLQKGLILGQLKGLVLTIGVSSLKCSDPQQHVFGPRSLLLSASFFLPLFELIKLSLSVPVQVKMKLQDSPFVAQPTKRSSKLAGFKPATNCFLVFTGGYLQGTGPEPHQSTYWVVVVMSGTKTSLPAWLHNCTTIYLLGGHGWPWVAMSLAVVWSTQLCSVKGKRCWCT